MVMQIERLMPFGGDAKACGGSNNPFVNPDEIKVGPKIEGNPFMDEEHKPYATPKLADESLQPRNRVFEKIDPEIAERLKEGEALTNEEALMLTVQRLRDRTEKLEQKEDCLLLKIAELEDLLHDKECEIKALEFDIREKDGAGGILGGGGTPGQKTVPRFTFGSDNSINSANGRTFRSQDLDDLESSIGDAMRSSLALDVTLTDGGPPPKLSSSFMRTGEKLRRAKAKAAGPGPCSIPEWGDDSCELYD